jgi:hypothetical protein
VIQENLNVSFWIKYKIYIIETIILVIFLISGLFIYLDYTHKQVLNDNVVSQEILKDVNEGLKENLNLIEMAKNSSTNKNSISQEELERMNNFNENERKKNKEAVDYTEQKLFDFLSFEQEPKLLDKLMGDLVIKNNSTSTPESTCQGDDLLGKDECKKSLFVGCAEALYLKFAIVNECVQFEKDDYVSYIKAKRQTIANLDNNKSTEVHIQTKVGEIVPSAFTLSRSDLEDTIDSSILNNDFTQADLSDVSNDSDVISFKEVEAQIKKEEDEVRRLELEAAKKTLEEKKLAEKKVLNSLLTSLTGVIVKYSGWVQGWATMFATNGGQREAGFKMYKTTAFGFNPYHPNTCLISLPYKTVDKFFGTNLNYCVRNGLVDCVLQHKQKVKGKPIEVLMIKNGKSAVFPLGDLGPAEWTGNAADLNGCAAKKLGATGKDQVRFRVAR